MSHSNTNIKAIVGLGNPGNRYVSTRHNIGFALLDSLAESGWGEPRVKLQTGWQLKDGLEICQLEVAGNKVWGIKPMTFMNCSGQPLKRFLDFHKIKLSEVIVAHDEVDIPLGTLKIKDGGGHAGHNGIRSVIDNFGTGDFLRFRLGVGRPPNPDWDMADWVLGRFTKDEGLIVSQLLERALQALKESIISGTKFAQNKFNC